MTLPLLGFNIPPGDILLPMLPNMSRHFRMLAVVEPHLELRLSFENPECGNRNHASLKVKVLPMQERVLAKEIPSPSLDMNIWRFIFLELYVFHFHVQCLVTFFEPVGE